MNNNFIQIKCKAIIYFIALCFIYNTCLISQVSDKHLAFKIKSPFSLLDYNTDSINVKQKGVINYSIGFGMRYKISEKNLLNFGLNFGQEKIKWNVYQNKYPNSFNTKLSFFTFDLDVKYGFVLNSKAIFFAGVSSYLLLPSKIKTSGKGTGDSLSSSSPDFSSNLAITKFDVRPNLSIEFKPFKTKNIKLLIGSEFSILKKDIFLKFWYHSNIYSPTYTIKHQLIQPFVCVNYFF